MSVRSRFLVLPLVAALLIGLPACAGNSYQKKIGDTLAGILGSSPDLSMLNDLVKQAGVEDLLAGIQPMTLLAPTNDAFQALGKETLDGLTQPENADQLVNILKNHVVPGSLDSSQLTGELESAAGGTLGFSGSGDDLMVNGAHVEESTQASNGWLHKVDQVLLPQ
jgi:uncharacterized surface protein with fasciclin (FAS1) repeats